MDRLDVRLGKVMVQGVRENDADSPRRAVRRYGVMKSPDDLGPRVVRFLFRLILRPLFRVELSGDPREFANERTLIVANHESFLDGVLLGGFLPVGAIFVVHSQITDKWYFRWLLSFVPHLAVDSTSPLAMKVICRLVETGTPVVIFPEGRLTITGSLMKVYDGAGQDRGFGPKLLWPPGGRLSAAAVAQDPHHDSTAADDPDAAAAVRKASPSARWRDHAPHPARYVGCYAAAAHFLPGFSGCQGDIRLRVQAR
jgi:hypothetical protein